LSDGCPGRVRQGIASHRASRKARIRTIVTATHTRDELQYALDAFASVGGNWHIRDVMTECRSWCLHETRNASRRRLRRAHRDLHESVTREEVQRSSHDTRDAYRFYARRGPGALKRCAAQRWRCSGSDCSRVQ